MPRGNRYTLKASYCSTMRQTSTARGRGAAGRAAGGSALPVVNETKR